jgi:hypothetical protein
MPTPQDELVTLYENLHNKYQVTTSFTIGLGHNLNSLQELSPDVISLLKHLTHGQITATDMDEKSFLKIKLTTKEGHYRDIFIQDTDAYMPAFDEDELITFLTQHN